MIGSLDVRFSHDEKGSRVRGRQLGAVAELNMDDGGIFSVSEELK